MSFRAAIASGFLNYANFNGRARRSEFWFWLLFWLIMAAAPIPMLIVDGGSPISAAYAQYMLGFCLVTALPTLTVLIRRLHDTGRSGGWICVVFLPVGALWLVIYCLSSGTQGANPYGSHPQTRAYVPVFD
jgi:uncharacterized membrane protein YhaH (DUF805 family)